MFKQIHLFCRGKAWSNLPVFYQTPALSSQKRSISDISGVKLITFDVTGTLLEFRKPPIEIYQDFGKKHGVICEREELQKSFKMQWKRMNKDQPHFGSSWHAWWTEFVVSTFKGAGVDGAKNKSNLEKISSELIEHFKTLDCWKLKDGAKSLVQDLKNESQTLPDFGIGIISNFDPRLRILLKKLDLAHIFKPIILSHERQISKPSREIFNLASKEFKSNVKPSQCLHVGDNYELDYLGAIEADWQSYLINSNLKAEDLAHTTPSKKILFPDLITFHQFLKNEG